MSDSKGHAAARARLLEILPADGASMGNQMMLQALCDGGVEMSDDAYAALKEQFVADGVIGKGRGRGGSIYRIADDTQVSNEASFELRAQAAPSELDFHGDRPAGSVAQAAKPSRTGVGARKRPTKCVPATATKCSAIATTTNARTTRTSAWSTPAPTA